ncbi:unnamed protein product [Orchesella dallaii]|uniref:Gustatory receptor n=1 Tax=Orchesella dallaii TaxID=48710 RepID=A0ABP1Q8J1_9HEXA
MDSKISKLGDSAFFVTINSFRNQPATKMKWSILGCFSSKFQSIIITFFKFAYKLCFSPFQIIQTSDDHFITKQWLPQQLICIAGMVSSVFFRTIEVRAEFQKGDTSWSPVLYFKLFHRLLNLVFNITIWITVWRKRQMFLDMVEFIQIKIKCASFDKLQRRIAKVMALLCAFTTSAVIISFIFGTDIFPASQWNPTFLYKCFAQHIKSLSFCIERRDCNETIISEINDLSTIETIMTITYTFSHFFRKVMGLCEELLILIGPLTLWVVVKDFIKNVLRDKNYDDVICNEESWSYVSAKYNDLKTFTDLVNRTFGPLLLSYTLVALFYFSIYLDEFVTADDILVKIKFLIYYVLIISTFTISAEIVREIGKLGPWISNNLNKSLADMSQKELTVVLYELSSNRIGMSACGLFTVTYSVVAQMTGVVVTYFIITVQYRNPK